MQYETPSVRVVEMMTDANFMSSSSDVVDGSVESVEYEDW